MRHIRSIHISERVVQRTLCDKVINPTLKPSFIYDNGASTENKGIDFALNRLSCHLQRHYRKYGREGYVLLFDFSNYFANAQHWPVSRELAKRVHDVRIRALANECLDNFGPIGYGLGSQISQTAALMLPNKLDHFIKEKLGIKGYARYMDDGYLIHPSKEYLKECLTRMKEVCDSLGIILNTKKTKIKKLSEGFKFLQVRFKLTETGKVLRKMSFESIKKIRRKLKKFKLWNIEGRVVKIAGKFVRRVFPLSDICSAYESWRGHMKRGNSFHAVERMDLYFKKLFGFHPNNKNRMEESAMYLITNSANLIVEICEHPCYVRRQANGVVVLSEQDKADAIYSNDSNTFWPTQQVGYLCDRHTLVEVESVPAEVVAGFYFYHAGEFYTTEANLTALAKARAPELASLVFVKMAETEQLDDATLTEHAEQFSEWAYPVAYAVKAICSYKGKLYRCVQAHSSQADWTPPATASLWKEIGDPTAEYPEWSQPLGAHDAYALGDKAAHNGKHWVSTAANNVWEPGVYGWEEVTE